MKPIHNSKTLRSIELKRAFRFSLVIAASLLLLPLVNSCFLWPNKWNIKNQDIARYVEEKVAADSTIMMAKPIKKAWAKITENEPIVRDGHLYNRFEFKFGFRDANKKKVKGKGVVYERDMIYSDLEITQIK